MLIGSKQLKNNSNFYSIFHSATVTANLFGNFRKFARNSLEISNKIVSLISDMANAETNYQII